MSPPPTLAQERALLRAGARVVAGMDEVGRGAIAGPVCVGVVALAAPCPRVPAGLRDSKLLTPKAREEMAARLLAWPAAHALGWASPPEVDRDGIVGALRLAGRRALAALGLEVDVVLLDGNHDWLSGAPDDGPDLTRNPDPTLEFRHSMASHARGARTLWQEAGSAPVAGRVITRVRADRECASVAAASVLAKCARDRELTLAAAAHPEYCWDANKGYGTASHWSAIERHGLSAYHRVTWRLSPRDRGALPDGLRAGG